ncbi:hypothetical protein [Mangrovactinospora gilvigrisea]|nr:hypothetical protein [Mangrovactinospora gilvigrisea]
MPHGVVVSPDGKRVFVANTGGDTGPGGSRTVSVLDADAIKVTDTWDVGISPHGLALTPDGATLLASCYDALVAVDTRSGKHVGRLRALGRAVGVAVHPDGKRAYVANSWSGTVAFVNLRSMQVTSSIRVGATPWRVAVDEEGSRVFVTTAGDDRVTALDAKSGRKLGSASVGRIPTALTVADGTAWVGTNSSGTLAAVNAATMAVEGTAVLGFSTMPTEVVVAPGA